MRSKVVITTSSLVSILLLLFCAGVGKSYSQTQTSTGDTVKKLVGRLDLEKYKATIKGLTQFGDRLHGTDRNRATIDWIEAELKSYGCTNTERLTYEYPPPSAPPAAAPAPVNAAASNSPPRAVGG